MESYLPKIKQRAVKVDAGNDEVISHIDRKERGTTKAPIIAQPYKKKKKIYEVVLYFPNLKTNIT
jgi:hypothetical protein